MFLLMGVLVGVFLLLLFGLRFRKYLNTHPNGGDNVAVILFVASLGYAGLILLLKYWDPGFALAVVVGGIIDAVALGIVTAFRRFYSR